MENIATGVNNSRIWLEGTRMNQEEQLLKDNHARINALIILGSQEVLFLFFLFLRSTQIYVALGILLESLFPFC